MSPTKLNDLPILADTLGMSVRSREALESFYFSCRLRNLTAKTQTCYAERIGYLMKWAASQGKDLLSLTKADLQRYITGLIDNLAPISVNGRIAAAKVVFKHFTQEGFIVTDPMVSIYKLKEPKPAKEVLSAEQMSSILAQLNRRIFNGARDHAMILLTFDAMLRLSELLSIRTDQVDLSGGIKVWGKGRKQRFVAFSPITGKILHSYITRFRKELKGDLLFCQHDGSPITSRRAHRIFAIPAEKIGIHAYPHLIRHSGATCFARSGGNLAVLQRALGHCSLAITQRYVHMDDNDVLREYERHSPAANVRI